MNWRFAEKEIRCRVSEEELEHLLGGGSLGVEIPLPGSPSLTVRVQPHGSPEVLGWGEGPTLGFSPSALQALAERLPAREGLEGESEGLRLSLEVDIRKKA